MKVISTLALLILMPVTLDAAGPEKNFVRAVVKHYDGKVEFYDGTGLRTIPLREDMPFRLGENDEMSITVEQTNPLLFKYEFKDGPSAENVSYGQALKFVDTLKKVSELLGPGKQVLQRDSGLSASDVLNQAGFTVEFVREYAANVESVQDAVNGIPSLVRRSGKSWPDARAVRTVATGWTDLLADTAKQLEVIRAADEKLFDYHRGALADPSSDGRTKQEPKLNTRTGAAGGGRSITVNSTTTVDDEATEGSLGASGTTSGGSGGGSLVDAFNYIVRHADEVGEAVESLRTFQKATDGIGQPVTKDGIVASAKEDRSQILVISHVPDAEQLVAKTAPKTGDFSFGINPDTSVIYEIDPAVLYSVVEREDWDTKVTPAGKYEIVRTDDGSKINGLTAGAMLSIYPRALRDWSFAPAVEVGFSPVKDRFGIFGGISFKVFDLFQLGGGIAYQQTEKLSSSQHLGKLLETADELDVDIEPDTGFYFSLTIDLGGK